MASMRKCYGELGFLGMIMVRFPEVEKATLERFVGTFEGIYKGRFLDYFVLSLVESICLASLSQLRNRRVLGTQWMDGN